MHSAHASLHFHHCIIISRGQRCQMSPLTAKEKKIDRRFELKNLQDQPLLINLLFAVLKCCNPGREWLVPLHEKMDFFEEPEPLSFLPSVTDTATAMRKHSENSNHQASLPFFYVRWLSGICQMATTLRAWVKPSLGTLRDGIFYEISHLACWFQIQNSKLKVTWAMQLNILL